MLEFEERSDQTAMSQTVWDALENNRVALIEAGTGIGKTLAYLAPALLWAYESGEKIVISTHTIALQQQLIEQEIPALLKLLGIDLKAVLVKGMNNYLCLRKAQDPFVQHQLGVNSKPLLKWAERTPEGSRSDLPFFISSSEWQKVEAEAKRCSYRHCPHFRECFFFESRKKLEEANLFVVNHYLLLSDLQNEENQRTLPSYHRLIIDEAHHFEEVGAQVLSKRLKAHDLLHPLSQLHLELIDKSSLSSLDASSDASLRARLSIDLPAQQSELSYLIESAFTSLPLQARIREETLQSVQWQKIYACFEALIQKLKCYSASLSSVKNDGEASLPQNLLFEMKSLTEQCSSACEFLEEFFDHSFDSKMLRWTQTNKDGVHLVQTNLSIGNILQKNLWASQKTIILCSATLAVNGIFNYPLQRLGIQEENLITHIHPSPFDYKSRTLLLASRDFPEPHHPDFLEDTAKIILDAMQASRGGAFLLFTSYDQLNLFYEKLAPSLRILGFPCFKQGELSRFALLKAFKQEDHAVLFGTDSFWEGVDVPGYALRCIVILKLPFKSPFEPVTEARADLLKKEGKDPFLEEALPQAVIKFKQGFGRLMRRKQDYGCILCLDPRLLKRPYGQIFLKSLPETLVHFGPKKTIAQEMQAFYQQWTGFNESK